MQHRFYCVVLTKVPVADSATRVSLWWEDCGVQSRDRDGDRLIRFRMAGSLSGTSRDVKNQTLADTSTEWVWRLQND